MSTHVPAAHVSAAFKDASEAWPVWDSSAQEGSAGPNRFRFEYNGDYGSERVLVLAGKATIKLKSGEVLERFVEIPKGEPDNFMNPTEFRAKFDGLCAPYMNADQVEKFAGALLSLEEANSMRSVLALSHGEA